MAEEEAENPKRVQNPVTPESLRWQPKQTRIKKREEGDFEYMEEARKHVFQDKPREGKWRTCYGKSADKAKAADPRWKRQKETTEESNMQAETPQTARKPKQTSAASTELTNKMEQQLRRANEVLEQMVNRMSGHEPPPYIKDMQQQLVNMQENMTQTERINQEINDDLHELEVLTAHTHQTLYRQQEQAAQLQTVVKPWPSEFADEDRDYVIKYYARKLEWDSATQRCMGEACVENTSHLLSPFSIGQMR